MRLDRKVSVITGAASGIGVPGPKIHDTPRLFRKS